MQKVYLGETQSGQVGLFTARMLAWPLSPSELAAFNADPDAYCARLGFAYTKDARQGGRG